MKLAVPAPRDELISGADQEPRVIPSGSTGTPLALTPRQGHDVVGAHLDGGHIPKSPEAAGGRFAIGRQEEDLFVVGQLEDDWAAGPQSKQVPNMLRDGDSSVTSKSGVHGLRRKVHSRVPNGIALQ